MGSSACTLGGTTTDEAIVSEEVVTGKSSVKRIESLRSLAPEEAGQEPLEDILRNLQASVNLVVAHYQRAIRHPKADSESAQEADEAVKRLQQQLRRMKLRTNHTCPGPGTADAETWLETNMGGHRTPSLKQVVQQVRMESRIVRRWRHKCSMMSSRGTVHSAPRHVAVEIDRWDGLDVFKLERDCQQPLTQAFMSIWRNRSLNLLSRSSNEEVLDLIRAIEKAYRKNAYHNRIHAADVLLAAYYLWAQTAEQEGMNDYFTEVDLLVVVVAAAVHDVAHPGVSNDFLVKTHDDLAIQYSDRSVLENFHAATAFSLMKEKKVGLLDHKLPSPPRDSLKSRAVDMILATDMASHKAVVEDMTTELANNANVQDVNKLVMEKHLLHMADISHPLRDMATHRQWTQRVREEFLAQGDREKELGFQPAPLFDREKVPSLAKSQLGFLEFVVLPTWKPMRQILGAAAKPLDQCLHANQREWEELAAKESEKKLPPPPSPCRARTTTRF